MSGKRARRDRQRAAFRQALEGGAITFTCAECGGDVLWADLAVDTTETRGVPEERGVPVSVVFNFRCRDCARRSAGYTAN